MNTNSIDFRNKVGRLRQAFSKDISHAAHLLLKQYKLDTEFITYMCHIGLLVSKPDDRYEKAPVWSQASTMSLTRLINIAAGKTPLPPQPVTPAPVSLPATGALLDLPINTPFLGDMIKSRKSLTMGFKFTKGKQLSAELSWYSSQTFETIEANNAEARRRFYEQEAFEVDGHIYRVVDLEAHLLKAVNEFFTGTSIVTTVRRIHYT